MRAWQQTLVDTRGGADGENYNRLVADCEHGHIGTNPAHQAYNIARTVRAIVVGAAAFETICQDNLVLQGIVPVPEIATMQEVLAACPDALDRIPAPFGELIVRYSGMFHARAQQDASEPTPQSTGFRFYEAALPETLGPYVKARLAAEDGGADGLDGLKENLERTKNISYAVPNSHSDNVAACTDVLVAMAAGLCIAKRRPCSAEEHTDFITKNIDVAIFPASTTREQRKGNGHQTALPYGYGIGVLEGNVTMLTRQYVRAFKKDNTYYAQWVHPSLAKRNWLRPGHCPASAYNRLRPRTDAELSAVQASLASVGLSRLIVNDSVVPAQLVLARMLPIARATIYADSDWQKRLIKAVA